MAFAVFRSVFRMPRHPMAWLMSAVAIAGGPHNVKRRHLEGHEDHFSASPSSSTTVSANGSSTTLNELPDSLGQSSVEPSTGKSMGLYIARPIASLDDLHFDEPESEGDDRRQPEAKSVVAFRRLWTPVREGEEGAIAEASSFEEMHLQALSPPPEHFRRRASQFVVIQPEDAQVIQEEGCSPPFDANFEF